MRSISRPRPTCASTSHAGVADAANFPTFPRSHFPTLVPVCHCLKRISHEASSAGLASTQKARLVDRDLCSDPALHAVQTAPWRPKAWSQFASARTNGPAPAANSRATLASPSFSGRTEKRKIRPSMAASECSYSPWRTHPPPSPRGHLDHASKLRSAAPCRPRTTLAPERLDARDTAATRPSRLARARSSSGDRTGTPRTVAGTVQFAITIPLARPAQGSVVPDGPQVHLDDLRVGVPRPPAGTRHATVR